MDYNLSTPLDPEICCKLREKNIIVETNDFYMQDVNELKYYHTSINEVFNSSSSYGLSGHVKFAFHAPSIFQVVEHLFYHYGLWLYAHPYKKDKYHFTIIRDKRDKRGRDNLTMYDDKLYGGIGAGSGVEFDSIYEAYIAGILYCINLV